MGERPSRPAWPPPYEPPPAPQPPARVRHVWVRPPLGRPGAKQGLVLAWRQVTKQASPPQWQALVVIADDRFDQTRLEWFYAYELEPVRSLPPC